MENVHFNRKITKYSAVMQKLWLYQPVHTQPSFFDVDGSAALLLRLTDKLLKRSTDFVMYENITGFLVSLLV